MAGLKSGQVRISVTDGKKTATQVIAVEDPSEEPSVTPEPSESDEEPSASPKSPVPYTMTIKGLAKTIKYSKLKKKAKTYKTLVSVKNAKGAVAFEKVSGNAKIIVKKNGTVKVKKKLRPGKYKVKIRVNASGDETFAPAPKTATATIRVKRA